MADLVDDDGAFFARVRGDLAHGRLEGATDDLHAHLLVGAADAQLSSASMQRTSATPPPGTMPSSTAARVALSASSTRYFFSLSSVSVVAPTFTMPTPPWSFASRSWSFSLS